VSKASEPKPTPGEAPEAYDLLVARLEKVVGELEGPGLGLEQSLERFAEGMRLAREAQRKLDEAERRIEKLVRSADGADEAVPLDAGDDPDGGSR